ncbi:MAG TPA: beta-L-arabinofuranosidase domain-containing protein [Terracidiphilus sp.]|nr:beta-L-arabinofuranosidase domain-containing protein [Terracidiphilus sp.]
MRGEYSRREFVACAAAALAGAGLTSKVRAEVPPDAHVFSGNELAEFDYGQVQLTGGPLKRQYDRMRASYLGLDNDRLLRVYRERAGMPAPGEPMGGWYGRDGFVPGHSLGQYISGLARFAKASDDQACRQKVHSLVEGFAATVDACGAVFAAPNAEKVWPCYILDKHLAGLMDAWQLCSVTEARDLLPRVYKAALPFIPKTGRDRIGRKNPPYDETYVLPENLFSAHELTGERQMYDRAVTYLLDSDYFDPLARGEDVLPGRHAYSHAIALSSAAKARLVLHEEKYLRTMENAWRFLTTEQQYATGGWGPNELFIQPHKGQLYESLQTTADHFETPCGSYAATKLARYLLCATGDGQYGDGLERVVLNARLVIKEPDSDGDYFYYSSYNSGAHKVYYPQKWPCCSGTLVQGVADYVKNIYFRAPDGVAVNLYAPSQVKWMQNSAEIRVAQVTEYPLGEAVTLRVDCAAPAEFAMRMRIPGWIAQTPGLRVNGTAARPEMQRGFAVLRRRWKSGDTVTLDLPQTFRTEAIDDQHPKTVAILRGPLVYVELSPAAGETSLAALDSMRPLTDSPGLFYAGTGEGMRVHAPLYFVRNESYTTYFENAG